MQYINPIEILGLSNAFDATSIDNEIIRKAKRKLFADIDLSDNNLFEYYGIQLTKGDCEKAIDQLSNTELKEFYFYLASNINFNTFLANGNDQVFTNFKQDFIFKLPEFVKFVSPYFTQKFDKALLHAYENKNVDLTKSILKATFLIFQSDINLAYKSVSNYIQNDITKITEIKNDIKNEDGIYNENNLNAVVYLVMDFFPSEIINCLPNYFQSQILKIANEINYLGVAIWENFDNTQVCKDLSEHILSLNISGLDRPTFEANYEIANRKNQERIEQERNAPILKKYAGFVLEAKSKIKKIETRIITPTTLLSWVNSTISIHDINKLPIVFDEVKNQVALSLKSLSVEVWNTFSSIDISIDLIDKANSIIGLKSDIKENIQTAKTKLLEIKSKIDKSSLVARKNNIAKEPTKIQKEISDEVDIIKEGDPLEEEQDIRGYLSNMGYKKEDIDTYFDSLKNEEPKIEDEKYTGITNDDLNWDMLIYFFAACFVGVICLIVWANRNDIPRTPLPNTTGSHTPIIASNENSSTTSNATPTINENTSTANNATPSTTTVFPLTVESPYKDNQLEDGASPLTGCFGRGIYNGNATLTIKNGGNSEAIICLFSITEDRTIRNEYVQKNSTFTMNNIEQGEYKIRVLYGNDWNPNLENSCGTKGNFESNVHFSEFDGTEFFEDSESGYTKATITLYTIEGGNASSSAIDQTKFFKK